MPLAPGGGRRRQGPRRPCPASRPRALPGPLISPPDGRQILGCVLVFVVLIRSALPQPQWRPDQSPRPASFGDRVLEYAKRDTSPQCLVLGQDSDLPSRICDKKPVVEREKELRKMSAARLLHCSAHTVYQALDPQCPWKTGTADECRQCFEDLRQRDLDTWRRYEDFRELIDKVRCLDTDTFSHQWTCHDCKLAYRQWMCSLDIPHYLTVEPIEQVPPCGSYCARVEQRCPYFLPQMDSQYAGEPTFLCRATSIPLPPIDTQGWTKCFRECGHPCGEDISCIIWDPSSSPLAEVTCSGNSSSADTSDICSFDTQPSLPSPSPEHQPDTSAAHSLHSKHYSHRSATSLTPYCSYTLAAQLLILWLVWTLCPHGAIGLT